MDHASQVKEEIPGGTRARVPAARLSSALWRRPWARATLLLTPPLAWFVLLYLAALVVLLITAFWQINPFTTNIERTFSLTNLTTIFTSPAYLRIIGRTVAMAAAVTAIGHPGGIRQAPSLDLRVPRVHPVGVRHAVSLAVVAGRDRRLPQLDRVEIAARRVGVILLAGALL